MAPVPVLQPLSTDYKLPAHRHSDQELAETRRRDALTVLSHGGYKLPKATHPAVLAIAYVLAIGGAAAPKMLEWTSLLTNDYALSHAMGSGYHLLIGCTLASLPIAAYIQFKQSLSRHHATFIAAIVFFALVFAALHYFPQLRYAT